MDEGRAASKRAYRKLASTQDTVDDALVILRACQMDKTAYVTEIPQVIGQLEALRLLVRSVVPMLADMAQSGDWMGHRSGE